MNIFKVLGIGYLFGCISPAAILGKLKNINLKKEGTGNLGATNTALVLGPKSGIVVLLSDIMKSMLSAKVSCALFPDLLHAGMFTCIGCMLGHCFPIFMHFEGGKGVAVYAGMVLLYNPWFAVPIIFFGTLLIILLNTGVAAPLLASVLFPVLIVMQGGDKISLLLAIIASILLVFMHKDNLRKAIDKKDVCTTREFAAKISSKTDR
jgi:glycerol-3-phosphate acyltransferase PlsY